MTKPNFTLATLGCRTNQDESEGFSYMLKKVNSIDEKVKDSKLLIVNIGTATASDDQKSLYEIKINLCPYPRAEAFVKVQDITNKKLTGVML